MRSPCSLHPATPTPTSEGICFREVEVNTTAAITHELQVIETPFDVRFCPSAAMLGAQPDPSRMLQSASADLLI